MTILFWTSVLVAAYIYVGYPALLAAWARVASRAVRKRAEGIRGPWPAVSVVVAARNEAVRLPGRVQNLLDQDYPGPMEIIVVSGGSTDDTPQVLARFGDDVRLIEIAESGKPRALNAGVAAATSDIIVFADARQRFAADAVRQLVSNFDDPSVGGVTGELILAPGRGSDPDASSIGEGVGLYWNYEKWLRRRESRIASTLGATGAIYALRRSLWRPLPPETLLDDVLAPMRAVLKGYRVVFDDTARAFDRVERDSDIEARRKTRTLAGNYQIVALEPRLIVPGLNPVWVQYVSHKLGRLLVPWCLVGALVSSMVLAFTSLFYAAALVAQLGFYGLALIGGWAERRELSGTDRAIDGSAPPRDTRGAPASTREQALVERR
jgi:biofilm PGA synthesis N-glycosyltransferase PgaC